MRTQFVGKKRHDCSSYVPTGVAVVTTVCDDIRSYLTSPPGQPIVRQLALPHWRHYAFANLRTDCCRSSTLSITFSVTSTTLF
jgi:hypothetical protein